MSLLLRFWRPLAGIAVLLLVWAWHTHALAEARRAERQQATSEMQAKLDAYAKQAEQRITEGYRQHETDIAQLAAIRSEPHPSVVCHRTSPQVRPAATVSKPETPGDRPLPEAVGPGAESFDPTDDLYALADSADDTVASCRMLNMAVHGMPSAPAITR